MTDSDAMDRYSRQVLFEPIGKEGQRKLSQARVTLIGCGALGSVIANTLVRAGVGFLRICDRDFVELNNLQRQVLFNEKDVENNIPKAIAAAEKLANINSQVELETVVDDVNHLNIERLIAESNVILDGTDNFETRYLINDASVKTGIPWVYGAVVGGSGLSMPIIPGRGPCLRCVFENAPPPEMSPTCNTVGILGPAVNIVASIQSLTAMKILIGPPEDFEPTLANIDVWNARVSQIRLSKARNRDKPCKCCELRDYEYLSGRMSSHTSTLCGHNAVQIMPPSGERNAIDFESLREKLSAVADEAVTYNKFMLKASVASHEMTIFRDGRAIIKGAKDLNEAKALYSRFVGN